MENWVDHQVLISSLFIPSLKKRHIQPKWCPLQMANSWCSTCHSTNQWQWNLQKYLIPASPTAQVSFALRQLCWKDCSESLQTNSCLQSLKDNFSFYKKYLFADYSKWTGGFFICIYFLICDSRQGLPEETQTGDISGKCAFMKLLQWWTIEHDSRLDWDLDSPSTAVHLGDEVLGRSEKWIFLLGNKFPEIIF